jgi:imidazolonepropionase-like amidohydrolase
MRFRALIPALICALLGSFLLHPVSADDAPERFAVRAAHMLDGHAAAARGPVWVVVAGDRIESVESSAPAGLDVVDLGDATLLPGLIDLHTHLGGRVGVPRTERLFQSTPARNAVAAVGNARATLMAGFTTCRDVGSSGLVDVALRDAIDAGEIPGPRLQVATSSLSMTGGHGDRMNSLSPDWCNESHDGVADGVDEVRK